jgi:hypothetical protein
MAIFATLPMTAAEKVMKRRSEILRRRNHLARLMVETKMPDEKQ